MSCLIPRSDKFASPKAKTKTGWKHLMRVVRSKLPLGLVRRSSNLRLNSQYDSSTRPFLQHHHYYRQYNHYCYQEHLSTRKSLSLSRTEGGCKDDKPLIFAPSPSLLMRRSQDEMKGSQSSIATPNTSDQDDVLHEDLHDHHVLEDGLHLDEEALGLDDVYKKITNTTTVIVTTTPTTLERHRLCGVDAEADKFIEEFHNTLALERKKSADKFWATFSTTAQERRQCGVDAKADQFIEEFRRRMRVEELERQKSA
ncbi:hypothetical protein C1H46_030243 [Malus baccata]|uniref:Uncharacterized protein n=1 Tax=Malus baccata TaxID=106549 RepID=A0A540LCF4_MALBA|nr:hypothetical protein C1H46_030243 [Malus baccata]